MASPAAKLISGSTYSVSYAYNLAGELTSITYPSGRVVQQNYDAIGRLSAILSGATNYASGYTYNPAFEVTGFNYGNGVTASFGYTPERLLLQTLSYAKPGQTLFSVSYGYTHPNGGKNGQITNITDNLEAGRTVNYTYDALYRVSTALTTGSATYPQWGLSWTYDRYGNRTQQTVTAGTAPSNSLSISATTNRITSAGFSYDLNGNLTQEGSASYQYQYDGENRMVAFNTTAATYTYLGASRIKKVSGSTTTVYVFSGSKVLAEYVNAVLSKEYVYAGGGLLATIAGSAVTYHHQDHLSTRLETGSSAATSRTYGQFPYGEVWYETGTASKWKFTTYERDSESGNDYAVFRYYQSRLGRFSSPDLLTGRLTNPQSLNRYAYVVGDAVNLIDPLGLCGHGDSSATMGMSDLDIQLALLLKCTDKSGGGWGGSPEEERHFSIITTGYDPALGIYRGPIEFTATSSDGKTTISGTTGSGLTMEEAATVLGRLIVWSSGSVPGNAFQADAQTIRVTIVIVGGLGGPALLRGVVVVAAVGAVAAVGYLGYQYLREQTQIKEAARAAGLQNWHLLGNAVHKYKKENGMPPWQNLDWETLLWLATEVAQGRYK